MSLIGSADRKSILIIVPWLQGGGAQGALVNLIKRLPKERITLVVLFQGNRNHELLEDLVASYIELGFPKSILGVWRAAKALRPYVEKTEKIYTLMRASHLVLGLMPRQVLAGKKIAATFHQLPSQDSKGIQGQIEDILVRRGVKRAGIIVAPSARAVRELNEMNFGSPRINISEPNLISTSTLKVKPPRDGELAVVRLVFAGRLTEQKGLDRVGELLLNSKIRISLRCLGDGIERDSLLKLAGKISEQHSIELISHVDDITEHLDWSDAVFLPSRWELNPLVVWEGRARGRPTVGSSIEAFRDLSESGPMWLFESPEEFSTIMENFSGQPDLRKAAYQAALDSYNNLNTRSSIVDYLKG